MKKTNILFLPYTFTNGGGAEKILQLLVNNLPQNQFDITIQEVEQFNKFLDINENVKLHHAFLNQKFPDKTINELNYILLVYFPFLLKIVFGLSGFDAVISFNYQLPSFMMPAFKTEKKIAWFHGDLYDLNDKEKKWERNKQFQVWKNADQIITISNKSKKSLDDIFPDFSNKLQIIHNGTDTQKIIEQSKEKIDLPLDNIPFVVCVGRLDENKNFILAIRALSELKKQNIDCSLVLVGEGILHEALAEEAEKLNILDKVFFAGFQTNPYKYIARSKLLCVTSFSEGWPTVVMESMALGKPFVTTPVSGASEELAAGGKCGLVAGYDEKEYADVLKKLLTNNDLYNQMSQNCKENVKQYSAQKYAENFINLLDELKVHNLEGDKKTSKIKLLLSYVVYFFLYIISFGEIFFRLQIITKRIKGRRFIKVIKNLIYFFGLIVLWPLILIGKIFIFPVYISKIIKQNGGKKCR